MNPMDYKTSGVDTDRTRTALDKLIARVAPSSSFSKYKPVGGIGFFSGVIDIGGGKGMVVGTDGVGSKLLIADMMQKYDTVGIDCIAMNVNDVICIGARPVTIVDYIALTEPLEWVMDQIGIGLAEGARQAEVSIVGGETAIVPDLIKPGPGAGDFGIDLVATCVGIIDLDKIITGKNIADGDVIIGFESSGVHSNGYSLARKTLLGAAGHKTSDKPAGLGRSLGETLLEPTLIYVKPVMEAVESGIDVKGMAHITGDGFLNLQRLDSSATFNIDNLPPIQPVFDLIRKAGNVTPEEMYTVFNMGIGYCMIVSASDSGRVLDIAKKHGMKAQRIGTVQADGKKRVLIPRENLVGENYRFNRV